VCDNVFDVIPILLLQENAKLVELELLKEAVAKLIKA